MKYLILPFLLFIIATPVLAQLGERTPPVPSVQLFDPTGGKTFGVLFAKIFDYAVQLAGVLLTIMVLYGAFQMLTAGDNENKFKEGKKTLTHAVIGFIVVIVAQGFAYVIKEFFGITTNTGIF